MNCDLPCGSPLSNHFCTGFDRVVTSLVGPNRKTGMSQLSLFDQSQTRQRLEALGALEIAVPCLTEVTRNKLQLFNLTVSKGQVSDKLHLLDRTRCARFHDVMAAEFGKAKDLLTWTRPTS